MRLTELTNMTTKALTRKCKVTPSQKGKRSRHPARPGVNKTFVQLSGMDPGLAAKLPPPKLSRHDSAAALAFSPLHREGIDRRTVKGYGFSAMADSFPSGNFRYRVREWRYRQRLRLSLAYFPSRRLRQRIRARRASSTRNSSVKRPTHLDPMQ